MNDLALTILITSTVAATICLSIAGVGLYRFGVAYIKGDESIW